MEKKLVLGIDFNNLFYGSYYGEKLINSKGMNVNAIKGFFFKLKLLKETFNPDYIVVANDLSRSKTFRRKIYKQYKSQRKDHDDDILKQLRYGQQLVSLLGYELINNEIYEADDILGMISKYTKENNMNMIICSSDRDLYQLINDSIFIFSPRNKELIDESYILMKYKLTPQQWIECKMLQGDVSDNIPGIRGIGETTALKLLHEYENIENIYRNIKYIKPSIRLALEKGQDILPLTRQLVTIITDYEKINFNEDMMNRKEVFYQEIYNTIEELEIPTLYAVMDYTLFPDKLTV